MKSYGCKYKSGHWRTNQNWSFGMPPHKHGERGIFTHQKEHSINDYRPYLKAKRFFNKHGFVCPCNLVILLEGNWQYWNTVINHPFLSVEDLKDNFRNYPEDHKFYKNTQ